MFILVSTVSFCIETLPMFDDSYVNKETVSLNAMQFIQYSRLHRCWWRMLDMKYVGGNFEMVLITDGDLKWRR